MTFDINIEGESWDMIILVASAVLFLLGLAFVIRGLVFHHDIVFGVLGMMAGIGLYVKHNMT